MGITGLLPLLKDIQRRTSVSIFRGNTVGIDAYCWLHKGVYGCAKDVVEGKKTNAYINYIMRRVNMLLNYNITPILVFDGGYLPAKASKEKERRQTRQENLKKAKAFLRAGNNTQAFECFQRCVEITPAMATEVIQACREKNVMCIVAPYEADAQLAYLELQGITQFTITEDSDLLIYGCKKVLFKMNAEGDGVVIDLADLNQVKTVALESFTMEKFRHMCILSGCDYLPSVKGLGLYKAHKFLRKSTNVYKAIQLIQSDKKLKVPPNYAADFRKTDAVFKYQSVFDPRSKKIVRVTDASGVDVTEEELQFAGPPLDAEKAMKIALGNIDPISGKPLADFEDFVKPTQKKTEQRPMPEFRELPAKPRNPDLQYAIEETDPEVDEGSVEDEYLQELERRIEEQKRIQVAKNRMLQNQDDSSLPERSLENVKRYEKTNPSIAPSIGILYGENKRNESSSSTMGHHSVFVKRRKHKFKNPFRAEERGDDDATHNEKSSYFKTHDETEERKESIDDDSRTPEDADLLENETKQTGLATQDLDKNSLKSPPPSKRAKFSFIKYLDSHSKISLKRVACKMSDSESGQSSPECEALTIRDTNIKDRGKINFSKDPDARKTCFKDTSPRKIPFAKDSGEQKQSPFPRLPDLPDIPDSCRSEESKENSLMKFMFTKKSKSLEKNSPKPKGGKISLFKAFGNVKCKKYEILEADDDELLASKDSGISLSPITIDDYDDDDCGDGSEESSQVVQSQPEIRVDKESLLQLKSRSHSDSTLSRSTQKKPLTGRCRKIGLSKKSRSSLDRVRENESKLSQSKLGFEKFSYEKKKINWKGSTSTDVVCTS